MRNFIVVTGGSGLGKTAMVRLLSDQYKKENVTILESSIGDFFCGFALQNCHKDTEVIVYKDFNQINDFYKFQRLLHSDVFVNKPLKKQFPINPELIIVECDARITMNQILELMLFYSFTRPFQLISL